MTDSAGHVDDDEDRDGELQFSNFGIQWLGSPALVAGVDRIDLCSGVLSNPKGETIFWRHLFDDKLGALGDLRAEG